MLHRTQFLTTWRPSAQAGIYACDPVMGRSSNRPEFSAKEGKQGG